MQITHHTQLLNALIEKYNLKSYLEIGVQNPANNFDKIRCHESSGADPEFEFNKDEYAGKERHYKIGVCHKNLYKCTSDEYFDAEVNYMMKVGLIFIDGLHHADQVKRDFENSLRCLSDNGFIVIHDVLPENEAGTIVPRQTKQWWGDVYKWAMTIREYDGIEFKTFNIDNGCMVVKNNNEVKGAHNFAGDYLSAFTNWPMYKVHGRTLMNVTDEVTI